MAGGLSEERIRSSPPETVEPSPLHAGRAEHQQQAALICVSVTPPLDYGHSRPPASVPPLEPHRRCGVELNVNASP
ncbi:hypothetical protein M3J09_002383 [Ascochyta lentis]